RVRNPERRRKCLTRRALRIANLIHLDAPSVIVANEIATFVRESSRLYGDMLVESLGGILGNMKRNPRARGPGGAVTLKDER
ncbi:MAG: hypothetical protein ABIP48_32710, partial [Planctomycetota bacterium]